MQEFFDRCDDTVANVRCSIDWSKRGFGFGQFHFYYDEDGKLHCSSEHMGPQFIKNILGMMVDSAVFDDFADGTYTGKEITPEVWNNIKEGDEI